MRINHLFKAFLNRKKYKAKSYKEAIEIVKRVDLVKVIRDKQNEAYKEYLELHRQGSEERHIKYEVSKVLGDLLK